eukprot:Seg859.7 transcript_id=Seg859.7/GoldUCD/mRNA.D3Y31 product=Caspase-3 protein_id=Seg859.7/GoldUCD/D3Y31
MASRGKRTDYGSGNSKFNTYMERGANAVIGDGNTFHFGAFGARESSKPDAGAKCTVSEETTATGVQETEQKPEDVPIAYEMTKGFVVLFHNELFPKRTNGSWRKGSERDAEALKSFFEKDCGFVFRDVNYKDLTATQMIEKAKDLSEKDFSKYDSFFCIVLSHGKKEGIVGVDEEVVSVEAITGQFTGHTCPTLQNKPKIFIIQACRGDVDDPGAVAKDSQMMSGPSPVLPIETDFLIAFASPLGYASYRNEEEGSWFVQSLVKLLMKYFKKEHLMDIFLRVNHEVAHLSSDENYKQIPSQECRLTKKCYFYKDQ